MMYGQIREAVNRTFCNSFLLVQQMENSIKNCGKITRTLIFIIEKDVQSSKFSSVKSINELSINFKLITTVTKWKAIEFQKIMCD